MVVDYSLGVEQRRSILQLVLTYDTHRLKYNLVLVNAMAESPVKALKGLEPSIERLVPGSSTTFELSYIFLIMCIRRADDRFLSTVSIVAYDLLSSRDLVFQAFAAKDIYVVVSSWERAIHPNERIMVDRNPKLIVHSSLVKLMRVKLRIL
jgi:hypothetical protein